MIAEINALGAVTKYTYDHRGNLIQMEDALGGISLFTYNYNDQKTAEVSPANYRLGKKLREMARTEYTYDAAGRISTRTDYEFDETKIHSSDWPQGFHRRVSETYTYDNAGNTTQIRDAEGKGAIYTYHPNGLVATSKLRQNKQKWRGSHSPTPTISSEIPSVCVQGNTNIATAMTRRDGYFRSRITTAQ